MKKVGIYHLLSSLSVWAILVILFVIQLPSMVGRKIWEGFPHQLTYSSIFGEGMCLLAIVLIATGILQRNKGGYIPLWLQSKMCQGLLFLLCVVLGMFMCEFTLNSRSDYVDIYHDFVPMSLILFSVITLLPIIILNGKTKEQIAAIWFVSFWLGWFGFDLYLNRISQFICLQLNGLH